MTSAPENRIAVLAVQNNQIVIAGDFLSINGAGATGIARLHLNGTVESSFASFTGVSLANQLTDKNGNPVFAAIQAVAVQPDNRIIIGGIFDTVNGSARTNLARLNPDGSLDTNFLAGTDLTLLFTDGFGNWFTNAASVSALALQPDGSILVGGTFSTINRLERRSIARLTSDGSLDTNFFVGEGIGNTENPGTVRSLALGGDGSILITGEFTSVHGVGRTEVARLNSDGTLDTAFRPTESRHIDASGIKSDGTVFVDEMTISGWSSYSTLKQLSSDGKVYPDFGPVTTSQGRIEVMSVQPDGKLLVAGSFQQLNINNCSFFLPGIARLFTSPNQSVVQFVMNQDPNTGLYSADISVDEDLGVATISLQRLGDTSGSLDANFSTSDGTAKAGVNYVATNGTLSFAPLEIAKSINIPLLFTYQLPDNLKFHVALTQATGAVLGVSTMTVTIRKGLSFPPGGITRETNGVVVLSLVAPAFANYVLEASTNLVN